MSQFRFSEVLNDLQDWFVLCDPAELSSFQTTNTLGSDLVAAFVEGNACDRAAECGVIAPMTGVANYPYTIYVTTDGAEPVLERQASDLQLARKGYVLHVQSGTVALYTARCLRDWPTRAIASDVRPRVQLPNGWYSVVILGGEALEDTGWEPCFEFVLSRHPTKPSFAGDLAFPFAIVSRAH